MTLTSENISALINNKQKVSNKMSEGKKTPGQEEVEELLVLRPHRARPAGELKTRKFKPGDKYRQNGLDKLQVLGTDTPFCTRDLKADLPPNLKRTVAVAKKSKPAVDPIGVLVETVNKLVEKIDQLVLAKK